MSRIPAIMPISPRSPFWSPVNQQQAYEMTREAFDLSEKMHTPVLLRLVTRLSHSRSSIVTSEPRKENELNKADNRMDWMLLPANARRRWDSLLKRQDDMIAYSEASPANALVMNESNTKTGVITTGLGFNYYMESLPELADAPSHLHIGVYPFPVDKIKKLAAHVDELVILEEGYPFVERFLTGLLPNGDLKIKGKMSGDVPEQGELNPDNIRPALGLPPRESVAPATMELAGRPPQLCKGLSP